MDDIAKFMFSDSSGPYQAPPYEKLMINTLNMVNYLTRGDLSGARVEARRLAVMQQFITEHEAKGAVVGVPGSYLAGFTYERSKEPGRSLALLRRSALQGRQLREPRRTGSASEQARRLPNREHQEAASRALLRQTQPRTRTLPSCSS